MADGTGVRANLRPFALLVIINGFVGMMVGLERSTLPLVAQRDFGLASAAAGLSFLVTFGLAKATLNLFAGALADRFGRKRILVAGWISALPVPLLLLLAPSWEYVVAANALLGVNQALAWSMTLNMKLDLASARQRGVAVGWNEFAGYSGVAAGALAAGLGAGIWGPRRAIVILGALVALTALALSFATRETHDGRPARAPAAARRDLRRALADGSGRDRALASASLAGFATNLKDGILWGALPLVLAARGFDLATVAVVAAAYPLVWGLAQLVTGPASDRVGRRALILPGLALQAIAVAALGFAASAPAAFVGAIAAGVGTALCYPTLLAFVGDRVEPQRRATALGVYRAWRDAGYAAGALVAGAIAVAWGLGAAFVVAAGWLAVALIAFAFVPTAPRPHVA